MSQNAITNLVPLKNLTQLTVLSLQENQIINIQPLKNLTELVEVNLSQNFLTDIRIISKWTKVQELTLSCNDITDISCFEGLEHLKLLMLSYNNIVSVKPLAQHSNLLHFYITNNYITDFSVMQHKSRNCFKHDQEIPDQLHIITALRQASIYQTENLLEAATKIRSKHLIQSKPEGIRKKIDERIKCCESQLNQIFALYLVFNNSSALQ
ncbi:leucine-rich_repeat domain-containing protein [Hexamita inflata]|uniref:Leucine-rich_repeat domain-containing protein n=1 Tax=Hexamita inflata TaxID=28002 RepID=A0ABP1GHW2_9EUKA